MYYSRNTGLIMANKTSKVSRQERKMRAKRLEERRIKKDHFDQQIKFIKHAESQQGLPSEEVVVIPRRSISLRVPAPLLNDVDFLALEKGISRSELIVLALNTYVSNPSYLHTGDYLEVLDND